MVYKPSDDSYLLQKVIIDYLKDKNNEIKILDMGSGSGIQAKTCIKKGFSNVLAADIDPEAVKTIKENKIKVKKSDLFSNIKPKFDLIIFNAPYLPESKYDNAWDTTAGKEGYEVIVEFLKQSKKHLNKNASILLLFSNFSKPNIIKKNARKLKYNYKKLAQKQLFFEKLYVYEFK